MACLISAALSAVVLVLQSRGALQVSAPWERTYITDLPVLLVVAVLMGEAATAAALAGSALTLSRPTRMLALGGTALPGLVLLSRTLREGLVRIYDEVPLLARAIVNAGSIASVTALVALGCAVIVAVIRQPGPVLRVAVIVGQVLPYVVVATLWMVSRASGVRLSRSSDDRFPESMPVSRLFEADIVGVTLAVAGTAMFLTVWLTYVAARGTVDFAEAAVAIAARLSPADNGRISGRDRRWWWLVALCGAKLGLYAAGLAGVGAALNGLNTLSADIRDDGWLSWLVAGAITVFVVGWLRGGAVGFRGEVPLAVAAAGVALMLALSELAYQGFSGMLVVTGWRPALTGALWVEALQPWSTVLAALVAAIAAVVLRLRSRWPAAQALLGIFAVWVGLRLPALVSDLIRFPWFHWRIGMPAEDEYGQRPGWVDVTTIDVGVSIALLGCGLLGLLGRRVVPLGPAALVAAATTLLANSSLVLPDLLLIGAGVYVGFFLPLAYQLVFDAESLNDPMGDRSRRLLVLGGLNALALAVGTLRGAHGTPSAGSDLQMATALVVFPVVATSVAMVAERLRATRHSMTSRSSSTTVATGSANGSTATPAST